MSGVKIDNLSFQETLTEIGRLLDEGDRAYMVTPNAAHIVLFQKDPEFKKAYEQATLVVPDSVPLVWVSRFLGQPLIERCAGSDLFARVCFLAASLNKRIFIIGGHDGSEKIVENKLRQKHPDVRISSYCPPYGFESDPQESARILAAVNDLKTDLLLICVGAPKSEKWLFKNLDKIDYRFAGSFGISLELFAGTEKRAPRWLQKAGLEWFWRLAHNPRRLAKRYVVGNTIFLWLVFRQWFLQNWSKSSNQ